MGQGKFSSMVIAVALSVSLGACTASRPQPEKKSLPPAKTSEEIELTARSGQVWVVRPDGSKSCGVKKGLTPRAAAQELEGVGVRVFKQRTGHDGLMRMMVCGTDTGNLVELLIDGRGLPIASKKGFRVKGED